MNRNFLRHLDTTGGQWNVEVFESRGDAIWSGILQNTSGQRYPVIDGIPRLLRGEWLARCLTQHQDFSARYGTHFTDVLQNQKSPVSQGELLKQRTVANFSYQWKRFNRMLPVYEANHRMYFHPRGEEFFAGRVGLDAGCGTGRHVYYAAKYGAEMVAIDLSDAVEVAYQNTRSFQNVHVAQADIYDLPLKRNHFDFVESVGVIHILPDPKAAVASLVRLLKPGSEMYIYVYSSSSVVPKNSKEAIKLSVRELYERIGRKLSPRALNAYCFGAAAIGRGWNAPLRLLQRWKPTSGLGKRLIAFKSYETYPFYVLHTDLFDWIGTPLNRYYTRDEVAELFASESFENVELLADPEWRVFARKAGASKAASDSTALHQARSVSGEVAGLGIHGSAV
jgi:SAM-dependent methyltransferase/uncharacterized protein YbaR (Trm112 family)